MVSSILHEGRSEGIEDGLDKVTHGTGVTSTGRVAIGDSGHAHQLLSYEIRFH